MSTPRTSSPRHLRHFSAALLSLPAALLAGCSMGTSPSNPLQVAPAAITGKVFGGQQPVTSSAVSLYAAGITAYGSPATLLASTTSDANGNFTFANTPYTCPSATTQVYLLAKGGNSGFGTGSNTAIALVAGIGNCSSAQAQTVNINEVSTAVTAFALAQFFTPILGSASTDSFGAPADINSLATANTSTIPTLLNLPFGYVNPSTSTLTLESAKIYTLANIIAACINSAGGTGACSTLFANTTPPGTPNTPSDTLQAAVQMALFPYQNVSTLFGLIPAAGAPFVGLASTPNDFTLAVAYTTPNLGLSVASGTSSNIDIDSTGNVWFPSNAPGQVGVAYFNPATNSFNGPYGGNISSAPISQPQYVSIDQGSDVFVTDQNSGNVIVVNSVSTQTGYLNITATDGGTITAGPVATDFDNTLYLVLNEAGYYPDIAEINASRTNLSNSGSFTLNPTGLIASFDSGDDLYDIVAATSAPSSPCNLEDTELDNISSYDSTNYIDASTSSTCASGGVAITQGIYDYLSVASTANQLCSIQLASCFTPNVPLSVPQGIATDGFGKLWIANAANGSISTLNGAGGFSTDYTATSPVAYLHNSSNGATMTQPYGLAIDGAGNVWVSNAGCVTTGFACTPGSYVLSELIGAAAPTITPLSAQSGGGLAGTTPSSVHPTNAAPHSSRPNRTRTQTKAAGSQTHIPATMRPN